MDEALMIIGLFAILGIAVWLSFRVLLTGCVSYRKEFKKTGLPKHMYRRFVAGKKRGAAETPGRISDDGVNLNNESGPRVRLFLVLGSFGKSLTAPTCAT